MTAPSCLAGSKFAYQIGNHAIGFVSPCLAPVIGNVLEKHIMLATKEWVQQLKYILFETISSSFMIDVCGRAIRYLVSLSCAIGTMAV